MTSLSSAHVGATASFTPDAIAGIRYATVAALRGLLGVSSTVSEQSLIAAAKVLVEVHSNHATTVGNLLNVLIHCEGLDTEEALKAIELKEVPSDHEELAFAKMQRKRGSVDPWSVTITDTTKFIWVARDGHNFFVEAVAGSRVLARMARGERF